MHHLDGTLHDVSARTEDGGYACLVEVVVVLHGDHTTSGNDDVLTAKLLELLNHSGNKGLVTSGERRLLFPTVILLEIFVLWAVR